MLRLDAAYPTLKKMKALFIGGCLDGSEIDLNGSGLKLAYPENTAIHRPSYALFQLAHCSDRLLAFAIYAPTSWSMHDLVHTTKARGLFHALGVSTRHLRYHRCMEETERSCLNHHFCSNFYSPAITNDGDSVTALSNQRHHITQTQCST